MAYRVTEIVLLHENAHVLHVVVVCIVFEDVFYQHMLVMLQLVLVYKVHL
jgi:hypothetical protein